MRSSAARPSSAPSPCQDCPDAWPTGRSKSENFCTDSPDPGISRSEVLYLSRSASASRREVGPRRDCLLHPTCVVAHGEQKRNACSREVGSCGAQAGTVPPSQQSRARVRVRSLLASGKESLKKRSNSVIQVFQLSRDVYCLLAEPCEFIIALLLNLHGSLALVLQLGDLGLELLFSLLL